MASKFAKFRKLISFLFGENIAKMFDIFKRY